MDNTYFILSNRSLSIERFQICTWKLIGKDAFVELGVEIKKENLPNEFDVFLAVPFAMNVVGKYSLHDQLAIADNCKLIFNDTMTNQHPIDGDSRKGSVIEFGSRAKLAIVAVDPIILNESGLVKVHIKTPSENAASVYFRVLVELNVNNLAIVHTGINKKSFIYDFKVNETRNLPEDVYKYKEDHGLSICGIASVFLFHCVPDDYDISYIDSGKLRNVRRLETDSFNKYLKDIETIDKDKYMIVFLKLKGNENYSFFTTFVKEHIGNKQIIFAILANIFCSLLFAYETWKNWVVVKLLVNFASLYPMWACLIVVLIVIAICLVVKKRSES